MATSWTDTTKNSTTWTDSTKNSTTYTNQDKSLSTDQGVPMGLLLALTYAVSFDGVTWTNATKN